MGSLSTQTLIQHAKTNNKQPSPNASTPGLLQSPDSGTGLPLIKDLLDDDGLSARLERGDTHHVAELIQRLNDSLESVQELTGPREQDITYHLGVGQQSLAIIGHHLFGRRGRVPLEILVVSNFEWHTPADTLLRGSQNLGHKAHLLTRTQLHTSLHQVRLALLARHSGSPGFILHRGGCRTPGRFDHNLLLVWSMRTVELGVLSHQFFLLPVPHVVPGEGNISYLVGQERERRRVTKVVDTSAPAQEFGGCGHLERGEREVVDAR
jgi:hypothetical protein